jgi:hypothetical protein
VLAGGSADGQVADLSGLPRLKPAGIAESCLAGHLDDRSRDDEGHVLVGVAAEGFEVAVIVVLVADHDRVQVRQCLRLEGDRLARVVERLLAEPGVGEHGQAAELDQVAAVGDPGDDERLAHDCPPASLAI